MKSVGIVGAGITGLVAAYRLQQRGIPVSVYEAADRAGGVIQTVHRDGYMAECGPNSILETSPIIGELLRDLGMTEQKRPSNPAAEKRFLVRNGQLVELPSSGGKFFSSPLFSVSAKARLFREPFIRRAAPEAEESVAEFVLRRLGREFLDYAINPLVAGVYAGNPAKLSVRHAFPKLHALEQRYGSLILGQFLGARERKKSGEVSKQSAPKFSFPRGLQQLTDQLHQQVRAHTHLRTPVESIERLPRGWRLTTGGSSHSQHEHGILVLAAPAHRLAQIRFQPTPALNLTPLRDVRYPPVASLVLGFKRADVAHPLDGFGVLIPEVERMKTLGCIFSSSLFANRAPEGHVLLTCYIGGMRAPELATAAMEQQVELALSDLRQLLGVSGTPTFINRMLYPQAIPQYEVGYGRFKDLMNEIEKAAPGVFFAGHYRDGISLSDSLVSGHKIAGRIADHLGQVGTSVRPSSESPTNSVTA